MFSESGPAPKAEAWRAVGRCVGRSLVLLAGRRVHLPKEQVGRTLHFADGSSTRVYRETTLDRGPVREPCVLVVAFRLRILRGAVPHRIFEAESLLNTPLFVGFPGFVSKLWCSHDAHGVYRGLYEWDDPALARRYASALWRVLALVSVPGTIGYKVLPGVNRDRILEDPSGIPGSAAGADAWWRLQPRM